jgi:Protein of unknown function (DUF1236)
VVARGSPFPEELFREEPMNDSPVCPPIARHASMAGPAAGALIALMLVGAVSGLAGVGRALAQSNDIEEAMSARGITPKLQLTPAQRSAIYQEVHRDKSKVAPSRFAAQVGADVPPMIELYTLPDDILASNPDTKLYKFTRVDDQIVLVDPIKMRVIAVIGPKPKE